LTGNLGIGVTPSAWSSIQGGAIQTSGAGAIWSTGVTDVFLSQNTFFNGSYRYVGTNAASAYRQLAGAHQWFSAASGTAGNAISFTQAMTLDANGVLLVGTTSAGTGWRARVADTNGTLSYGAPNTGSGILRYEGGPGNVFYIDNANATGSISFRTDGGSGVTERARIESNGNFVIAGTASIAPVLEKATISATAATGTIAYDAVTQAVLFYTTNASANWTVNFRGNSTTTLNSMLAVGQSLTLAFLVTNGSVAYLPSGHQIDGTSITPKWAGGSAPTTGNTNSIDVYTYTIVKTAATPTYQLLASVTRYA